MNSGGPCCAHLKVSWYTRQLQYPPGATEGWWACHDCATRFSPNVQIAELKRELQEMSQELGTTRLAVELPDNIGSFVDAAIEGIRLKKEIEKLQAQAKADQDFIELQARRLSARLDQLDRIRKAVAEVDGGKALDP